MISEPLLFKGVNCHKKSVNKCFVLGGRGVVGHYPMLVVSGKREFNPGQENSLLFGLHKKTNNHQVAPTAHSSQDSQDSGL